MTSFDGLGTWRWSMSSDDEPEDEDVDDVFVFLAQLMQPGSDTVRVGYKITFGLIYDQFDLN